jgi:hypothetical protein
MKNLFNILIALCLSASFAYAEDKNGLDPATQKTYVGIVNRTDKAVDAMSLEAYETQSCCTPMSWHQHMPVYVSDGIPMACCTVLPDRWSDDMRVLIRWRIKGDPPKKYRESVVPVEKYVGRGTLYVHFFMDGKIRLVVSRFNPTDERHPISPREGMPPE